MRLRNAYFTLLSGLIIMTLVLPKFFGFMSISQWGGMYTDHWCTGTLRGDTRYENDQEIVQERWMTVGNDPAPQLVWYAPQFNKRLCAAWLRTWCGRPSYDGWEVREVFAGLRNQEINDGKNLCDDPPDGSEDWFQPLT